VVKNGPYLKVWRGDKLVYQHKVVMEDHLGRALRPGEVIHHINGNGHDNRIENLMLFDSHSAHMRAEWEAGTPLFGMRH